MADNRIRQDHIGQRRVGRLVAAIFAIGAGLALRRFGYDVGLPFFIVKYGGSALWGAMVFFLLGTVWGTSRLSRLAAAAVIFAVAVECVRLYHTPDLDEFRLTVAGQLLLGRVFSVWNILAYGLGILAAALAELVLRARHSGT